ncbi:MAG: hypothetical protein V2A71_09365, partial [Candidatus Eisenbacteria bacterium]
MYDEGLRALAEGDYTRASDRFQAASLAARELMARGQLEEADMADMRSIAQKADHLGSNALQTSFLRSYIEPQAELVGPPLPDAPQSRASSARVKDGRDPIKPAGAACLTAIDPEMNQ